MGPFVVVIILALAFAFAIRKLVRDKKNKKCGSCTGDCSMCGKK